MERSCSGPTGAARTGDLGGLDARRAGEAGQERRTALLALAGYTALAALLFYSAWKSPATLAPGNAGDAAQTAWWLRWFPYAIGHLRNPLLTDHIDAPDGVNLMWNTSVPLPGVVLSPITLVGGPLVGYAVLVTAAPALNAWTAFLAIRRLVPGVAGPVAGGLLFGFSPFVLAQSLAHPHVTLLAAAPLQLMALQSLLIRRAPPLRTGVLLGLAAAAQLFISEEMLVIEVVVAVVSLAILAVMRRSEVRARLGALRGLAAATVTLAIIAAVPLTVQFLGPQHPHGSPESPDVFVTDVANLVLPTPVQALAPDASVNEYSRRIGSNTAEEDGYIGIPLLAVGVVAAGLWWRRPLVRWAALSAAAVTVLAFGAHVRVDGHEIGFLPMPWRPLQSVPLLSQVLPARFMGLAFLFVAILVAVVVSELVTSRPTASRVWWAMALAATVVTLAPALPYPAREWSVPTYFTGAGLTRIPEGALVLLAPFPEGRTAQTMLWQAAAGMRFRIVGGYAYHPDAGGRFTLQPTPSTTMAIMQDVENGGPPGRTDVERQAMMRDLRSWNVDSVVVGPDEHSDALARLFEQVLGRPADVRDGGVAAWYDVGTRLPAAAGT